MAKSPKSGKERAAITATAPSRGFGMQAVYSALRQEIVEMSLSPGEPLDETRLAARFQMSRTPIREALQRLASEGHVRTLPNRSTIVSPIDFEKLPAYFDSLTLLYRVTTRLAAMHRTVQDIEAIRELSARFDKAVDDADALTMIGANRDLHVAIAVAGDNPFYTDFFSLLLDSGRRLLRIYYRTFDDHLPRQYVDEHARMITAIVKKDPDLADRLAADHARQIVGQIQAFLASEVGAQLVLSLEVGGTNRGSNVVIAARRAKRGLASHATV